MDAAFELYASGWFSVKRLCATLAVAGMHSRSGGPIPPSHLTRLLANPFYAGRLHWKDLQVPGQHPALVSADLFDRGESVLRVRHRRGPMPMESVVIGKLLTMEAPAERMRQTRIGDWRLGVDIRHQ